MGENTLSEQFQHEIERSLEIGVVTMLFPSIPLNLKKGNHRFSRSCSILEIDNEFSASSEDFVDPFLRTSTERSRTGNTVKQNQVVDKVDTFSIDRNSKKQTFGQTIGHGQDMYIPTEFQNPVKVESTIAMDKLEKNQQEFESANEIFRQPNHIGDIVQKQTIQENVFPVSTVYHAPLRSEDIPPRPNINQPNSLLPINQIKEMLMPGISYVDITEQYNENHNDVRPDHTGGTHQQETGSRDNVDVSSDQGTSDIFNNLYEPLSSSPAGNAVQNETNSSGNQVHDFVDPYFSSEKDKSVLPMGIDNTNHMSNFNPMDNQFHDLETVLDQLKAIRLKDRRNTKGQKKAVKNSKIRTRPLLHRNIANTPAVSLPSSSYVQSQEPMVNKKTNKPNEFCKDKDNYVPSVYIKIKGLELPICMNLNIPKHQYVTLIKHGEESLDIKTGKCESIIDKRFYSAEYIQAVYVPDHQLTMYTDLVMMNHSNREWQEDEIFDLPFPTEAMKIRICRSRGSLKGLQIYMDVGTDNTGYSGLLGSLADMSVKRFNTKRQGKNKTVANIVIEKNQRRFSINASLKYGTSKLVQQCWETHDTRYFDRE